jgi:hypothetical protein
MIRNLTTFGTAGIPIAIELNSQGIQEMVVNGQRRRLVDIETDELDDFFISVLLIAAFLCPWLISFEDDPSPDLRAPSQKTIGVLCSAIGQLDLDDHADWFQLHMGEVLESIRLANLNRRDSPPATDKPNPRVDSAAGSSTDKEE